MEQLPIGEIKKRLVNTPVLQLSEALEIYAKDSRVGVQKLVASFQKKIEQYQQELERTKQLSQFEKKYYEQGYQVIGGIDEVGRGPLAGPVVACAVVLKKDCDILYINDSKKLTPLKREKLYQEITTKALSYCVGIVPANVIDEINILQATYKAMQKAIAGLHVKADVMLVDAVTIPSIPMKQVGIVKGDEKSISIGAASIVAKVTRDRMMQEYDKLYPDYGFAENKGYGSKEHIQAIREKGICPIHRKTFVKNFV